MNMTFITVGYQWRCLEKGWDLYSRFEYLRGMWRCGDVPNVWNSRLVVDKGLQNISQDIAHPGWIYILCLIKFKH
jgi:hypothetical protein